MGSRHGDSFWEEEKGNIGLKLMQCMGWKMGAGLGRTGLGSTDVIKIKQRKGMEGIGSEKDAGRDEMWTAATSAYNDLLKRLACGGEASTTPISTAATIQQHKSRQQLYSRFKKSNRSYSEKDREAIFGRRDAVPAFPTFSGMGSLADIQSNNAERNEKSNEQPAMKKTKESKTKSDKEIVVKKAKRSDSKGIKDNQVKKKKKDDNNDKKEKKKKAKDGDILLKKSKKKETTVKKKRKRDETELKKSKTSSKESGTVKKKRKTDKDSSKKSKS